MRSSSLEHALAEVDGQDLPAELRHTACELAVPARDLEDPVPRSEPEEPFNGRLDDVSLPGAFGFHALVPEGCPLWYDIGQATMSIMLAAADLGIGSGHASIGDQALVRNVLGVPEDRECAMFVALGYPADRPLKPIARPNRRTIDDVVHRDGW